MKEFSNQKLLDETKVAVREERKWTLRVLHCIAEVERRRLHLERGFSSLHEFLVKELKYSDGAAFRRIAAMRLLKDVPEAEKALDEGKVSLSTLSQIQSFVRSEKVERQKTYTSAQKLKLVEAATGKSSRECEQMLASLAPKSARPEMSRAISEEQTETRITLSRSQIEKLERVKQLHSHKIKSGSYAELLEVMADLLLADRQMGKQVRAQDGKPLTVNGSRTQEQERKLEQNRLRLRNPNAASTQKLTRYIPKATERAIWIRDQGQCTYRNPKTKQRCSSKWRLQIDHIEPFSLGGSRELENLRLLCAAHNQMRAIETFGQIQRKRRMSTNNASASKT